MAKTKVYYNSACPVCAAGIADQKRRMEGCSAEVEWLDVHADNALAEEAGADLDFIRERLHVIDENGTTRVGSQAFAVLWSLTPEQGRLARLSRLPGLSTLFGWAYNAFAAALYRWNRWHKRW